MSDPPTKQLTTHSLISVPPPSHPVYRISRLGTDPFEPAPWEHCGNNRFDDLEGQFRIVYCATERAAAFGETLARFRRSLSLLALLRKLEDDEESIEQALGDLLDPTDERRGVVPIDWRFKRQIGATQLDPELWFAAIVELHPVAYLRSALAPTAQTLGISDFDLSAVFSTNGAITQHCARHIYQLHNDDGAPRFAGISYPSRINPYWTCWAIFDDRIAHIPVMTETTIDPHDPGLLEASELLELSIEAVREGGIFIQPARSI